MNFEQIQAGHTVTRTGSFTAADIERFSELSGDYNPIHLDDEFAARTVFGRRIAHGMLSASLISAAIASDLCGPGVIYLSQELKFHRPVYPGDELTAKISVLDKIDHLRDLILKTELIGEGGVTLISGSARVRVPKLDSRSPQ